MISGRKDAACFVSLSEFNVQFVQDASFVFEACSRARKRQRDDAPYQESVELAYEKIRRSLEPTRAAYYASPLFYGGNRSASSYKKL